MSEIITNRTISNILRFMSSVHNSQVGKIWYRPTISVQFSLSSQCCICALIFHYAGLGKAECCKLLISFQNKKAPEGKIAALHILEGGASIDFHN